MRRAYGVNALREGDEMDKKREVVLFEDGHVKLEVPITPEKETVWLTQEQMSELFETARSSIAYHIGKIFSEEELDKNTSVEIFDRSIGKNSRPPMYYSLEEKAANLLYFVTKNHSFWDGNKRIAATMFLYFFG